MGRSRLRWTRDSCYRPVIWSSRSWPGLSSLTWGGSRLPTALTGGGGPLYHPRVLVVLILYCRAKGLMSARQVAGACPDDLGVRLITGNRYPDRSTIDRFLDVHAVAVKVLLPQTLRLARDAAMVEVNVVAGDGTEMAANAAKGATVSEADLLGQIAELEQAVRDAQRQWASAVGAGLGRPVRHPPNLFTGVDGWDGVVPVVGPDRAEAQWRKMRTLAGVLDRRGQALAWLREHPDSDHTAWWQRVRPRPPAHRSGHRTPRRDAHPGTGRPRPPGPGRCRRP